MADNRLLKAILELNQNTVENTKSNNELKAEIKAGRKVDEANAEFLRQLCLKLIDNDQVNDQQKSKMLGKVLNVGAKVLIILLLALLGLKELIPLIA